MFVRLVWPNSRIYRFLAFDLLFAAKAGGDSVDVILAAREVRAVVDLLPFLTASSCLF